jgi:hypothetical protein
MSGAAAMESSGQGTGWVTVGAGVGAREGDPETTQEAGLPPM